MRGLHKSDVGCICTCARAHLLRTMVPPRPLVHRRSRRHTGNQQLKPQIENSRDHLITSGARRAERVYFYIPEKSQYERPAGHGPRSLNAYFSGNGMTNSRTVILIRCHHPINHVFGPVPIPTGACPRHVASAGERVSEDTLSLGNSTTAGPIAFKFGV